MENNYPKQIQEISERLRVGENELKSNREQLALIEDKIVQSVIMEKTDDGKAKYSNETTRKSEIAQRCLKDIQHVACSKRIAERELNRQIDQIALERARGEFSVWKIEKKSAIANLSDD